MTGRLMINAPLAGSRWKATAVDSFVHVLFLCTSNFSIASPHAWIAFGHRFDSLPPPGSGVWASGGGRGRTLGT